MTEANQRRRVRHAALHLVDDLAQEPEPLPESLRFPGSRRREVEGGHRAKGSGSRLRSLGVPLAFQPDFSLASDLCPLVTAQPRSLPILRIVAVIAALAILVGAYGIWYLFFRPSGAAPVGSSNAPAASFSGLPAPATADGTWKVDT